MPSKRKIDPDVKLNGPSGSLRAHSLRTVLKAVIEEYAQNAGTDFMGAFRDALTDLKHIADDKEIDFDETVIVALDVEAQETVEKGGPDEVEKLKSTTYKGDLKMSIKNIYAKFKANESLSNDELVYLIDELKKLESTLGDLGLEYRIITNAIRLDLMILDDFKFFRKI